MVLRFLSVMLVVSAFVAAAILTPSIDAQVGRVPESTQLQVAARDMTLVCPGALFKAGGSSGTTLGSFARVGTESFASQFNSAGGATLSAKDGVFAVQSPVDAQVADSDSQIKQGSVLLNAGQYQLSSGATLQGLAAANCQLPSNDFWLVGGDTTTGRESLLVLRNVGRVDASVSLEIFGEGGRVNAPGLTGIAVVAGTTSVIPLSGLIPKTKSFVTHVNSTGGAIAGWVQQRTIRGLSAGGVDYVGPSPSFSKELVLPGIFVRGAAEATKLIASNSDFQDLIPTIRVFVPGESAAVVTVQVSGANSKTFGTVVRETVKAGTVQDIEVPGLKDGDYVAVVSADAEVQASVRLSRLSASTPTDFTWIPAAEGFNGARNISIPLQGISKLCVFDSESGLIEVIQLTPGSTFSFPETESVRYSNLIVDINGTLANLSVLDQKYAGGNVSVRIR